jgi:hypothetical protein
MVYTIYGIYRLRLSFALSLLRSQIGKSNFTLHHFLLRSMFRKTSAENNTIAAAIQ